MRNEYAANIELSKFAAYSEENRKQGKPSREYRKARENKRNHGQIGILAHDLALIAVYTLAVIVLVKVL